MDRTAMGRRAFLTSAAMLGAGLAAGVATTRSRCASAATAQDIQVTPMGCAYSIDGEQHLRDIGLTVDLSALGPGEFPSFCFSVSNVSGRDLDVWSCYVTVDGGEQWGWAPFTFGAGTTSRFHVFHVNMQKCLGEGFHTAALYVNDELACVSEFTVVSAQNWGAVFPFPSQADIEAANQAAPCRSPYLAATFGNPDGMRFTSYSVDFKAEVCPEGTYCCLCQWAPDYAAIAARYPDAQPEYDHVAGYAGLQHRTPQKGSDWVSILSFWDIYYTGADGSRQTLRAQLVYPEPDANDSFGGEGEGAHRIVPYPWKEGRWYRMQIECSPSDWGTTLVTQWFCDLSTGKWTRQCCYDTQIPNLQLVSPNFAFLENYHNQTCGEVRCMELANVRMWGGDLGQQTVYVDSAWLSSNGGEPRYSGSYAFGAQANRFWFITSGVGGDWYNDGRGQKSGWHYLETV